MYNVGGLSRALWTSAVFGISGLFTAVSTQRIGKSIPRPNLPTSSDAAENGNDTNPHMSTTRRGFVTFSLYVATGTLIYSAIVPFWFFGGGFIRSKWGYTLDVADAMMLFTEGGMVVLSPPLGIFAYAYLQNVPQRLAVLAACSLTVPLGLMLFAFAPAAVVPPVIPMLLLSVGYAATNVLFWSLSMALIPQDFRALGSGILGSGINFGATVLPVAMAKAPNGQAALMILTLAGVLSTVGVLSLWLFARSSRPQAVRSSTGEDLGAEFVNAANA